MIRNDTILIALLYRTPLFEHVGADTAHFRLTQSTSVLPRIFTPSHDASPLTYSKSSLPTGCRGAQATSWSQVVRRTATILVRRLQFERRRAAPTSELEKFRVLYASFYLVNCVNALSRGNNMRSWCFPCETIHGSQLSHPLISFRCRRLQKVCDPMSLSYHSLDATESTLLPKRGEKKKKSPQCDSCL